MPHQKQLKKIIEEILERDHRARNDDNWLIYQVLRRYTNLFIPFEDFYKLPKIESIIRARARIQNEESKFQPTDPEVEEKRASKMPPEEGVTFEKPAEVWGER